MEAVLTPYQKDALHYNKHIALTANAGSGKTFVLAKRYVDIAQKEEIPLRKIVAITFTDKAAGELNKKIALEVEERLNKLTTSNEIRILEKIRRQLVSANISTIHSFCIDVLKEFSPEAGLDANFVPIDQTTADELVELSIEETLNHLLLNDSEFDIKDLIRFFSSRKILSIELKKLLKNRMAILELNDKIYSQKESEIADWFRNIFNERFKYLFIDHSEKIKELLAEINDHVLSIKPENPIASITTELIEKINPSLSSFEYLELINQIAEQMFTKSGSIKARGYLPNDERGNLNSQISEAEYFIDEITKIDIPDNPGSIEELLAAYGKKIVDLFLLAADEYTSKKEERGFLDFEDILHHTKRIIAKPDVQEYLSSNYEYIMIDEYQDTNEIQYEIFMPILNNLKSGNLFVVGDEKQSIYMFRDADIKVFMRTKKEIEKVAKKNGILSLPHSFRVSPPIAAFTNELFRELFKEPDFELNEVEHSNLVCAKPEDTLGSVEMIISDEESEPEAELVAKKIITLMSDENPDFGLNEIAILCRKRSVFAELEKAFSNHGIPHTVVAGKGFYQKQIVNDIHNYLSFLVNSDDDTSLVGILRAPFFTISDTEIFSISLEKGKSFFNKLIEYSSKEKKNKKIINILTSHISLAKSSEFSFILRRIINDTEYLPVLAAKENYKQELSNLEKLFSVAKSFEQQGFKSLFDFVDYLKTSIQNLVDEGQAAINEDEQSVKIMTIHQAKGLEFNTVFLFRCNDTSEEDKIKSRSIVVDKDFGILTKVPNANNYFKDFVSAPVNGIFNYISNRKNIGELKRLLYVGVTRAVQNLIITATTKNNVAKKKSFLDFITSGLEIDLESPDYKINTKLEFMKLKDEEFEFFKKKIEFDIPIHRSVECEINSLKPDDTKKVSNEKIFIEYH
jgi:ATP-dependent helicase/nuclease subunit A